MLLVSSGKALRLFAPFKTHLTAWNLDPCGNKREAVISGGHEQARLAETFNIYQMKTLRLLYI